MAKGRGAGRSGLRHSVPMNNGNPDLTTTYLGLPLRTPFIPSASPLSATLANLEEMEQCGAGAVVFQTLFEEPFSARSVARGEYCERVTAARDRLHIPVIASLSAMTAPGWTDLARAVADAGADALELNIYEANLSTTVPSSVIESNYIEAVQRVIAAVKIPVAVKLPPFFTNLSYLTKEMEEAGAKGFVLFNRFYLPDVDLLTLSPKHSLKLSSPTENRLSMRWISLLYRPIQADLVANTGIRTGEDALKMILAGAAGVEICSVLLQHGIPWLSVLCEELRTALRMIGRDSVRESRGCMARDYRTSPGAAEREEYKSALQGYEYCDVPSWREPTETSTQPVPCTSEN